MKNLILFLFLVSSSLTNGQTLVAGKPSENGMSSERLARIDLLVNEYVTKKWTPGAVVLIARNGKIVFHKAYGFSDAEKATLLKKDDIFRIASQSKAVTSLAVLMLHEEGKFGLDEPISNYLPEFKNQRVIANFNWTDSSYTTQPAKGEVTIRQLLTHTSGIDYAAIGSQEFKALYRKQGIPSGIGNHEGLLADKMKKLGSLPLKHQPGEAYTYGLNIDLLGYLVEVLSGMPLDQFLRTRIFQPLGMNDTYFFQPKEKQARVVGLYQVKNGVVEKVTTAVYDNVRPEYPTLAGTYFSGGAGLSSTVEDYAKFLQLFLNKGEYNGVRIVSRKTVELMLTPQIQPPLTNQFGFGFSLETDKNDYTTISSMGTFSGGGAYSTQGWADPKEKLVGLIFTNIYSNPYRLNDRFKVLTYQAIID